MTNLISFKMRCAETKFLIIIRNMGFYQKIIPTKTLLLKALQWKLSACITQTIDSCLETSQVVINYVSPLTLVVIKLEQTRIYYNANCLFIYVSIKYVNPRRHEHLINYVSYGKSWQIPLSLWILPTSIQIFNYKTL